MILSISRRTDIPAFYSDWLINRYQEGYVYVRNPFNPRQVSSINLSKHIDGIVFWSKNPRPLMDKLTIFTDIPYYFQFTLNAYGNPLEASVPPRRDILKTFKELSDLIGPERVIWRYDPIILTDTHTMDYHKRQFASLADELHRYTRTCVISFVDMYKKSRRNMQSITMQEITKVDVHAMAKSIWEIAESYGLAVKSCAEPYDLESIGIEHGRCIDAQLLEKIGSCTLKVSKDKNQRAACGCVSSIDIGAYNTCMHHCLYCYANFNKDLVEKNHNLHQIDSPLLIGTVGQDDVVTERITRSVKSTQRNLDL